MRLTLDVLAVDRESDEPLHRQMDNYNNGMLCAPHRD